MTEETPYTPVPPTPAPAQSGLTDNNAAGLAYLTFIPAIIFLVTPPYNQKPFIKFNAWQCIFLSIASFVIHLVLMFIPFVNLVLTPIFSFLMLVLWVICLIKAFKGEMFKAPVIGELAAKQAGM